MTKYFKDSLEGRKNGFKESNGYILIYEPNHPNAHSNGWIREHRWIMSKYLGRPLKDNEVVHHINGFKKDNRIENLELLDKYIHDKINYRHLNGGIIYCYLCGSDKTHKHSNGSYNWHFDIDRKIICGKCYGYIHQRYVRLQKGIKPRKDRIPRKYIPVFEFRVLKEFNISNSSNTVITII